MAASKEVAEAARLYQTAMTALGLHASREALSMWASVPANRTAGWASRLSKSVATWRGVALTLAAVYYRLVRAILLGSTVEAVDNPSPEAPSLARNPTLNDLRREFRQAVEPHVPKAVLRRRTLTKPKATGSEKVPNPDEPLPAIRAGRVNQLLEREDRRVLENFEKVIKEVSNPKTYEKGIDTTKPATEVDAERRERKAKAGAEVIRLTEWATKNAGRDAVNKLTKQDKDAIGWVRYSTTGTPCGWCAMLMTRGFIRTRDLYNSKLTAEGEKYHPNCQCQAVPIYSLDQLKDPMFEQNRFLTRSWGNVTRGLAGDKALTAWRKWVRNKYDAARAAATKTTITTLEVEAAA